MALAEPRGYSREEVNGAGDVLVSSASSPGEMNKAREILDHWRAIHSYPMHVFKIRLKGAAEQVDRNSLTVQRLKRVPAILRKLAREYPGHKGGIKLFEIQDIAGCRSVLSNVSLAKKLAEKYYLKGELKHKRIKVNDYVANPKKDGYRSYHIIYEYRSDKDKKKKYNGLLVEIQIRSKLQHLWATAIETVDFFTKQAIKSSEGREDWKEFFRLLSSAFAKIENSPCVPNTPADEKELYLQIRKKEAELNVIKKMQGWSDGLEVFQQTIKSEPKLQFFLLELDIIGEKLMIKAYTEKQQQKAIDDYSLLEKRNQEKRDYDVVLVGADTTNDLKKAYPNYFADTKEFLGNLKKIINKYPAAGAS